VFSWVCCAEALIHAKAADDDNLFPVKDMGPWSNAASKNKNRTGKHVMATRSEAAVGSVNPPGRRRLGRCFLAANQMRTRQWRSCAESSWKTDHFETPVRLGFIAAATV
jgi:hypothetical protein